MNGRLVARDALSVEQRERMLELLQRCFRGVDRRRFDADLAEKNWAVLIEDDDGRIVGFSTVQFRVTTLDGETLSVVCSGDTIVDPDSWGSSALPRTWIDAVWRLHREHGRGRLVWLLITSGFRTYRFLPVFWREFWPRHDRPLPPEVRVLRDRLATAQWDGRYDPAAGVVRFRRAQPLREFLRAVPDGKRDDPHVGFFDRANPGHPDGDELVCLTELSPENLTAAGRRMVRSGARRRA